MGFFFGVRMGVIPALMIAAVAAVFRALADAVGGGGPRAPRRVHFVFGVIVHPLIAAMGLIAAGFAGCLRLMFGPQR